MNYSITQESKKVSNNNLNDLLLFHYKGLLYLIQGLKNRLEEQNSWQPLQDKHIFSTFPLKFIRSQLEREFTGSYFSKRQAKYILKKLRRLLITTTSKEEEKLQKEYQQFLQTDNTKEILTNSVINQLPKWITQFVTAISEVFQERVIELRKNTITKNQRIWGKCKQFQFIDNWLNTIIQGSPDQYEATTKLVPLDYFQANNDLIISKIKIWKNSVIQCLTSYDKNVIAEETIKVGINNFINEDLPQCNVYQYCTKIVPDIASFSFQKDNNNYAFDYDFEKYIILHIRLLLMNKYSIWLQSKIIPLWCNELQKMEEKKNYLTNTDNETKSQDQCKIQETNNYRKKGDQDHKKKTINWSDKEITEYKKRATKFNLTNEVIRTYQVALQYNNTENKKDNDYNVRDIARLANHIVSDLEKESYSKMTKERVDETILLFKTHQQVKKVLNTYKKAYIEALKGENEYLIHNDFDFNLDPKPVPEKQQFEIILETLTELNNQLKFTVALNSEQIAELTEFFYKARFTGKNAMISLRNWYKLRDKHLQLNKKKKLHDGSNLGQSAYTYLIIATKEYIERCNKVQTFCEWLMEDKNEHSLVEWFIFGRVPWLESRLGAYHHVKRQYSINLIHGSRRTLDKSLPDAFQLKTPLPIPTNLELQKVMVKVTEDILHKFTTNANSENYFLSKRQLAYQRKLVLLEPHYSLVSKILLEEFFKPNSQRNSPSRWYLLKNAAKRVYHELKQLNDNEDKKLLSSYNERSFFSVIRNFIVTALIPHLKENGMTVSQYAIINEYECLKAEKLLVKPFQKKKKNASTSKSQGKNKYYFQKRRKEKLKLPLKLEMGSKYVVLRPGNGKVLTELALKKQQFPIILKQGKGKSTIKITAKVIIHSKLKEYLMKGAEIATIILRSGKAPAYKLQAQVTLKGEEWVFYSKKVIQQAEWVFKREKKSVLKPVTITNGNGNRNGNGIVNENKNDPNIRPVALDINRPHDKMLVFSEIVKQPNKLNTIINNYQTLEGQLKTLNRKLSKLIGSSSSSINNNTNTTNDDNGNVNVTLVNIASLEGYKRWKADKLLGEINRIYNRRKRLLRAIHLEASIFTTSVLIQGKYNVFGIEDLDISARNTKGALAKAILSMPDEQRLYTRAVNLAQMINNFPISLELVNPRYSSQAKHINCPVAKNKQNKLERKKGQSWDEVTCNDCGQLVNIHDHSALVLRESTYKQYIGRLNSTTRKKNKV